MTACCDTDVIVFGHTQADCEHTMLPPIDIAARQEHLRWLEQLATRPGAAPSVRSHFRSLIARSRT